MKGPIRTAILVPARLASARFPEKLLHPIKGKSLILHVAERIRDQGPEYPLVFAVDDPRLAREIESGGFEYLMTSKDHPSGTDRLAEANRTLKADYVINIQGDEPLVSRDQIIMLGNRVEGGADMATLATVIRKREDFADPNQVKVVLDQTGHALYFSRSSIPFFSAAGGNPDSNDLAPALCYRHLGMYAYKATFLEKLSNLPPTRLEQLERLEQLRVLENGHKIAVGITSDPSIGIDTLADAARFERQLP